MVVMQSGHIPKEVLQYLQECAVEAYKEKEKNKSPSNSPVWANPDDEAPYGEFMDVCTVPVLFPKYLCDYLESIAKYNSMTVSQVLTAFVHQMYAADVLSGIPTDFSPVQVRKEVAI